MKPVEAPLSPSVEPRLSLWIDATHPSSGLRLFGMTLLERSLRSVLDAGVRPFRVVVEHASGEAPDALLPAELLRRLPLSFEKAEGEIQARISRAAAGSPGPLLAWEAAAVVDPRLLAHLCGRPEPAAVLGGEGPERTGLVRLEGVPPSPEGTPDDLATLAAAWVEGGALPELDRAEVPAYLSKLRRSLPAYCFRVPDTEARDRAERFLFWSNYKGSTDFLTKYVYPPLVWRAVRPLARWRVHPNWVSALNVCITFGAIPLFAAGRWVSGLLLAYTMSVLDSVDGKLARLTYRSSRLGHVLDHGLDVVHPPLWYLAWAWALTEGDPGSGVFLAAIGMTALYFLDRIVTECFTRLTGGRSIHAYTELDVRMRTFVSRRNVNLVVFTVGLLMGAPGLAFGAIVAWQAGTLVFHAVRLLQVWLAPGSARRGIRSGAER